MVEVAPDIAFDLLDGVSDGDDDLADGEASDEEDEFDRTVVERR